MIVAVSGPSQHGFDLLLQPSFLRWAHAFISNVLMLALIAVALFLRGGSIGTLVAVLIVAGASAVVSMYFSRVRVRVTPDELISTGLLRTRRIPRAGVASVVTAAMPRSHKASRTFPHVFVFDEDGRRVVRLRGTHWLEDDMRRLIRSLGKTPQKVGGITTGKQLADSHPRAVSLLERHPVVGNAVVVIPGIGLAAAVVYALSSG